MKLLDKVRQEKEFFNFSKWTKVNLNELFNQTKNLIFFKVMNQITNREGDSIEHINLNSTHIDFEIEKELLDKVYFNFQKELKLLETNI